MNKFFPTISVRVKAEFFQRIGSVLATSHRLTASVDEKTECCLYCQGRGCQIQAQQQESRNGVKHFINLICINSLPLLLVGSFR